jgi:rhamnose transport system permease protein
MISPVLRFLLRYSREASVALAFGLLLLLLATIAPRFYRAENMQSVLLAIAPMLVLAVGMTLVILARQIDISIGSQFSLCVIVAALLAKASLAWPLAAAASLLVGAMLGAINGGLVAGLGLPSIVTTLATLTIWREALRWWRGGEMVGGLPSSFRWFGAGKDVGPGLILGVAAAVFLLFALAMRYLRAGRAVYAVGSDQEAARLAGLRPRGVVFGVFVVMGALAGLAGLLHAVRFEGVQPDAGAGLELQVIAAVVVGGTAVSGGRGTLAGTLIGVALLATVGTALVFLGATAQWEKAIQGLILLLAVASDALYRKGR